MSTKFSDVYAVPGKNSIIDTINPETGLTSVYARTEAEVLELNPGAKRMTWDEWQSAAIARQQTRIEWHPTTAEQYDEMLNVLPPARWAKGSFLVGEASDHCLATGRPRFAAYRQIGDNYFVASRPLTVNEWASEIGN